MRIKPTVVVSASGNSPPLIEPDKRISRIRLSEAVHRRGYRGRPLRPATQCPWKRANLSCRCYLPRGSHRTALRFAVHVDQVRSLRSSPVTGLRRYYEPLRLPPPAERASRVHRLCPSLDVAAHRGRSHPLFPPAFRAFHPRRPRRSDDWTSGRSSLSRLSQGLL